MTAVEPLRSATIGRMLAASNQWVVPVVAGCFTLFGIGISQLSNYAADKRRFEREDRLREAAFVREDQLRAEQQVREDKQRYNAELQEACLAFSASIEEYWRATGDYIYE